MEENFSSEFMAFDEENELDALLSSAMTHAVARTKEIENSREKEYLILMELLKHGNVCVREDFEVSERTIKELDHVDWDSDVAIDKQRWKEKTIPYRRDCTKNIVRLDSVYFGDVSKRDYTLQSYIFLRTYRQYEDARAIFGNWARWKYVKPGRGGDSVTYGRDRIQYLDQWRLGDLEQNEVEIIEYFDKWNDEYQIIINGVMMLPVGFPIPWDHKEYPFVFRTLYPVSPHYAYGHGLCHIMRSNSDVRDFMLRFAVDRTLQDLLPPLVTKSKRALTSTIFIPARVTHDVDNDLTPVVPNQLPASAINMIEFFERSLDQDSISPVIAGQESSGSPTAFEIGVQQKHAIRALGPIIFNFMWLIKDLDWLRCQNVLENLARPKDKKLDPVTKKVVNVYEKLIIDDVDIGKGETGTAVIEFAKKGEVPNPLDILARQIEEKKKGRRVKYSYVDADFIRRLRYRFVNEVKSSPRKNSDVNKILFTDLLNNAAQVSQMTGRMPNADYITTRFASTWGEDPEDFWQEQEAALPPEALPTPGPSSGAGQQMKQSALAGGISGGGIDNEKAPAV
jgi:hypothetical protein